MTRVIAGRAGGRRLAVPAGRGTRPTSDRAREGLFATALSMLGDLDGRTVLDLYAGSGAVGLEALSRGARHALMVESDPRAVRVIKDNVASLGLPGAVVLADRVERVLARPAAPAGGGSRGRDERPYDFVFADPPYAFERPAIGRMLEALRDGGWLAPDAVICIERPARDGAPQWPAGYTADRMRRYGDAALWYGRATPRA